VTRLCMQALQACGYVSPEEAASAPPPDAQRPSSAAGTAQERLEEQLARTHPREHNIAALCDLVTRLAGLWQQVWRSTTGAVEGCRKGLQSLRLRLCQA
jgi:type II secretory pathway component PulM